MPGTRRSNPKVPRLQIQKLLRGNPTTKARPRVTKAPMNNRQTLMPPAAAPPKTLPQADRQRAIRETHPKTTPPSRPAAPMEEAIQAAQAIRETALRPAETVPADHPQAQAAVQIKSGCLLSIRQFIMKPYMKPARYGYATIARKNSAVSTDFRFTKKPTAAEMANIKLAVQ